MLGRSLAVMAVARRLEDGAGFAARKTLNGRNSAGTRRLCEKQRRVVCGRTNHAGFDTSGPTCTTRSVSTIVSFSPSWRRLTTVSSFQGGGHQGRALMSSCALQSRNRLILQRTTSTFLSSNTPIVFATTNPLHRPPPQQYFQQQQQRSYLYLPTSWKELELRWLRTFNEKRTVSVQLLRDKVRARYDRAKFRYRAAQRRARLSYQSFSRDYYDVRVRQKLRWKSRGLKLRNRMVRRTRDSVDRMQRAWNRNWLQYRTAQNRYRKYYYDNYYYRRHRVTLTEYSEPSWFCRVTGRPKASRDATGRFVNPWLSQSADGVKSIWQIAQWRWERTRRLWQEIIVSRFSADDQATAEKDRETAAAAAAAAFSEEELSDNTPPTVVDAVVPYNQLKFTWIGHNTCLFQHGSVTILTDPIFSTRASPFQSLPVGVARDVPAAVEIEDLPESVDVCLVSHDHYDHLDKESVIALQPRVKLWVVPVGLSEFLQEKGGIAAEAVIELEWWESVKLVRKNENDNNSTNDWQTVVRHSAIRDTPTAPHPALSDPDVAMAAEDDNNNVSNSMWITCCPVQHWASRTFFDRNFRLWCSFAVFLPGSKFFFGGDTALPSHFPLFDQIRDYIGGNLDLAALPIGAYEPAFYMRDAHMSPEEAVKVHRALGNPRQSVAIHWGTFSLSEESMDEPPRRLREAATRAQANFAALKHGESITLECRAVDSPASTATLGDDSSVAY